MAYIKKNAVFILLCTSFILIIGGLFGYRLWVNAQEVKPPIIKHEEPDEEPVSEKPEFTSFTGEYDKNKGLVNLYWTLDTNDKKISSVKLYHMKKSANKEIEIFMADVKDISLYSMPQSVYGFPTGVNTFRIEAVLTDGTIIKKSVTVNISLILSTQQSIKVDEKKHYADVTLTYIYGKDNPVDIPTILVLDSTYEFSENDIHLSHNEQKENGDFITAKATYRFTWSNDQMPDKFSLRWRFDKIENSYDYTIDFSSS